MDEPPPKKGRRLLRRPSRTEIQLQRRYRALSILQVPLERGFWWLEQQRSRLQDRIANLAGGRS